MVNITSTSRLLPIKQVVICHYTDITRVTGSSGDVGELTRDELEMRQLSNGEKPEVEAELNELSAHQTLNPPLEFSHYKSLLQKIRNDLDGADEALKARIVTTLIKRIEILPAGIRVHYRMGQRDFSIDLKGLKRSQGLMLEVPPPSGRHRGRSGSNTTCNGGPTWNRTKN